LKHSAKDLDNAQALTVCLIGSNEEQFIILFLFYIPTNENKIAFDPKLTTYHTDCKEVACCCIVAQVDIE
jgi:hypothetical protein